MLPDAFPRISLKRYKPRLARFRFWKDNTSTHLDARYGGLLWQVRSREQCRQKGVTIVEFVIALGLVSIVFAITFEVLRDYLGLYKKTVGDLIRLEDLLQARSFLGVYLRERTKGLTLHPGSGGAIPVGIHPSGQHLIGTVWVSNEGKKLCWLESVPQTASGSVVYAWAEGNNLHLIISGIQDELYARAKLIIVSGLPAPSPWLAEGSELPSPPPNYPTPCYGFVARITSNVSVDKEDIPESAPDAAFYRKNIKFSACRRITVVVESQPEIGLPRAAPEIISDIADFFIPQQEKPGLKASFSDGVRKMEITNDGGLIGELDGQKTQVIFRRGTLGEDSAFRYIAVNLEEKMAPPGLREQIGVSFSGSYTPPETGVRGFFYIPLIIEDWTPAF